MSGHKYNNTSVSMTTLGNNKRDALAGLGVIKKDDSRFVAANLSNQCSKYDYQQILNILSGEADKVVSDADKTLKISQKAMVQGFGGVFGKTFNNVAAAQTTGLTSVDDLFTSNSSTSYATYYNLLNLAFSAVCYDPNATDGVDEYPVFLTLLESGRVNILGSELDDFATEGMLNIYNFAEKKLPETLVNGEDGRLYYFVNYYGEMLYRPYFSQPQWTQDGTSFICMTTANKEWTSRNTQVSPQGMHMYMYNVETQTIKYLDDCGSYTLAVMGDDDYIYYIKVTDWTYIHWEEFWRVKSDGTEDPEWIFTFPRNIRAGMPHVTYDEELGCYYASFELRNNSETQADRMKENFPGAPDGAKVIARIRIGGEKKYTYAEHAREEGANFYVDDYAWYGYNYSNTVNHIQINPRYPDLFFFAHETNIGDKDNPNFHYQNIHDRSRLINIATKEITPSCRALSR